MTLLRTSVQLRSMLNPEQRQQLVPQVRQMQIVVGTMAMGVFLFAMMVLLLDDGEEAVEPSIVSWVAIVFGLVGGVLGVLIPRLVADRAMHPTPATYLTKVIVACALFEGAAFFSLVAYMLEHQYYSLFMAVLLLGGILLQFPTVAGVAEWIEHRERLQRELKGLER